MRERYFYYREVSIPDYSTFLDCSKIPQVGRKGKRGEGGRKKQEGTGSGTFRDFVSYLFVP